MAAGKPDRRGRRHRDRACRPRKAGHSSRRRARRSALHRSAAPAAVEGAHAARRAADARRRGDRGDLPGAHRGQAVHRTPARSRHDLRRPGRHRHQQRRSVRRGAGADRGAAANRWSTRPRRAEVLSVISRSPTDASSRCSTRSPKPLAVLCEPIQQRADSLRDGDLLHVAATHNCAADLDRTSAADADRRPRPLRDAGAPSPTRAGACPRLWLLPTSFPNGHALARRLGARRCHRSRYL